MRENDNLREILQRFSIEFSRREKEKEKEREKEKEWEKEKEKEEEDERKLVEGGVKFERKEGTEGGGGKRMGVGTVRRESRMETKVANKWLRVTFHFSHRHRIKLSALSILSFHSPRTSLPPLRSLARATKNIRNSRRQFRRFLD